MKLTSRHSALRRVLPALIPCAVLLGCDGGKAPVDPDPPTPTASVVLDQSTGPQFGLVTGRVRGVPLPAGALQATLGTTPVVPQRLDDSTFALLVPNVAVGPYSFSIQVGSQRPSASLAVTAAPTVSEPALYIQAVLTGAAVQMDSLAARYADPLRRPAGVDTAVFRRDRVILQNRLAEANAALQAATPAERAAAAAMLAANAELLGLGAPGAAVGMPQATGDGACISESGQAYSTYEECGLELDEFMKKHRNRALALTVLTAVTCGTAATGIGAIACAGAIYLIYAEVSKIQDGAFMRFINPVIARLAEPFQDPDLLADPGAAGAALFREATPGSFGVMAEYRSLAAGDASHSGLGVLVAVSRDLESALGRLRSLLGMEPMPPLVPAAPRSARMAPVPARYLSVGTVTPAGVSATASAQGDRWMLTFSREGLTDLQQLGFEVRYAAPGMPVQTTPASATLLPRDRTYRAPISYTDGALLTVTTETGGYSCSWVGTFTGSMTVTYRYTASGARAAIQLSGVMDYPAGTSSTEGVNCLPGSYSASHSMESAVAGGSFQAAKEGYTISGTLSAAGSALSVAGSVGFQYSYDAGPGRHYSGGGGTSYTAVPVSGALAPAASASTPLSTPDRAGERPPRP